MWRSLGDSGLLVEHGWWVVASLRRVSWCEVGISAEGDNYGLWG